MPCTNCMASYSMLRKEHGCSNCGYGFCGKCVSKKFLLPNLSNKPIPVCDGCYQSLTGEIVQPLEKSRNENCGKDGQWWGDGEKPPPSMRNQIPIKPKIMPKKQPEPIVDPKDEDLELMQRMAKLSGKPVEFFQNPRSLLLTDDAGPPQTSQELINQQSAYIPDQKNDKLDLPNPPNDPNSIEGLEERLAALRNVPVEIIRKPRLLVTKDLEDGELDDDAKELLEAAERRLKNNSTYCYENEGMDDDD